MDSQWKSVLAVLTKLLCCRGALLLGIVRRRQSPLVATREADEQGVRIIADPPLLLCPVGGDVACARSRQLCCLAAGRQLPIC